MKRIQIIILLSLTLFNYNAKKNTDKAPIWVSSYGIDSEYSEDKYLTGFAIAPTKGKDSLNFENAKSLARNDISGSIKSTIVSALEMTSEEKNEEYNSYSKMNVQTLVQLNISAIKTYESYYDNKDEIYYALCVVDKNLFIKNLELERKELFEEYKSKLSIINTLLKNKKYDDANNEYLESNKILQKLNENYLIANYLKSGNEKFDELYKAFESKANVYDKIKTTEINNLQDLAKNILIPFEDISFKGKTFAFIPAYYKSTTISSEFFSFLKDYSVLLLEKKGGKRVIFKNEADPPDYVFKGSFFDTKKGYKILYCLTDSKENKKIALSEIDISNEFVESTGIEILPDNIEVALEDNKLLNKSKLEEKTAIKLKAWTNKGSQDVLFKKGEEVEFYVQVNKTGYISILYHLAGEKRIRTPLVENFFIPPSKIFKEVKISDTFEVYPPYGTETAQVFFSTKQMDPIQTVVAEIDGEEYEVLAADYKKFMEERGLKKSLDKDVETAETFITITTVRD